MLLEGQINIFFNGVFRHMLKRKKTILFSTIRIFSTKKSCLEYFQVEQYVNILRQTLSNLDFWVCKSSPEIEI
jgi:hypothetical protein